MQIWIKDGPMADVPWRLVAIVGEEGISRIYSFTATLVAPAHEVPPAHVALELDLLGRAVSFQMHDTDMVRHGIVASVEVLGETADGASVSVKLEIRPRVWVLGLRRNTRIFQQMYPHAIVSQILTESGIPHRWNLTNTYPLRQYCTQYQETDLEFIERLLAEEGVLYFFEHDESFAFDAPAAADASTTVSTVAGVLGAIAAVLPMIAPQSSTKFGGIGAMVGGLSGIVGDAMSMQADPEDDKPFTPNQGQGVASSACCDVFVFVDSAANYGTGSSDDDEKDPLPLVVTYRPRAGNVLDTFTVTSLAPRRSMAPGKVELRDYNFRRPLLQLKAACPSNGASAEPAAQSLPLPAPLEIYEHHGEYEKPDVSPQQARDALEAYRARAAVIEGRSLCPRMLPGFTLSLDDAPALFTDGVYVPVRVFHEAHDPGGTLTSGGVHGADRPDIPEATAVALAAVLRELGTSHGRVHGEEEIRRMFQAAAAGASALPIYQNRFEWIMPDVAFRPPRPTHQRNAVNESAVVVGPTNSTVYQDRFGRIKVQFQWDREGKYDEHTSCWIRVVQPWAGAGYGFQFIPRVGMEVIVTFLGGDPDRPIVMGSVYNTTHATPEPLPQRATRSGIRTQTPGGTGFNEVSFEDNAGTERVYIHAQKDLVSVVNDAHVTNVKGSQTTTVAGKQRIAVGGQAIHAVGGDAVDLAGANHTEQVTQNHVLRVGGDRRELVDGASVLEVRGLKVTEVAADDVGVVRGDHTLSVHGNSIVNVGGLAQGTKGNAITQVQGSSYLTATERVVIRAENWDQTADTSSIRLECGKSYIEIKKDRIELGAKEIRLVGYDPDGGSEGRVTLKSNHVYAWGKTDVQVSGGEQLQNTLYLDSSGVSLSGSDKITIANKAGASFGTDGGKASVQGSEVSLSKPGGGPRNFKDVNDDTPPPNTKPLALQFTHTAKTIGDPIAGARCRMQAGEVFKEDTTGGDGSITFQVPADAKSVHVTVYANELSDFADVYPAPLEWDLHVVDDLGAASDVAGARMRLQNLGFTPGTDPSVTDIAKDKATALALADFQRRLKIRPSGALDQDDTGKTLDAVYQRTYQAS